MMPPWIQREIEEPCDVLNTAGVPCESGWARETGEKRIFNFSPSRLWTPTRFWTEQETYIIFSNSFLFVFERCDNGLFSFLHISAVSLLDKHISSKTINIPVFFGGFNIIQKNKLLEFIIMENRTRIIKVDIPQIGHNRRLRGEVVLFEPHESGITAQSLSLISNWASENKRFKMIRSSPWWSVEGVMQFENIDMPFLPGRAWGVYYSTKMARPKHDIHYWAAGSGMQDGRHISFSLGYGSEDSSNCTENAVFINGVLKKLEYVTFQPPSHIERAIGHTGTHSYHLNKWVFSSNNNQLNMDFYPLQKDRYISFFLNHYEAVLRLFGFFSGVLILDDGSELRFDKICGVVERRRRHL